MKKKKDQRRLKTVPAMNVISPFIMNDRIGSMNLMKDKVSVSKLEQYIKEKQAEGMTNISMMHVLIAAYVRLASQRPQINRFIRGQRIWTRRSVEISLTIKKEMKLESPDTVVKATFDPSATLEEIYTKMNEAVEGYRNNPGGDFDNVAGILSYAPALLLRGIIGLLRGLDYFSLLPKFLQGVSPFHCSMFITSMGSLGIPPIYHHLYNFGTCPVFISFGTKKREYKVRPDGSVYKDNTIELAFALDERICDGYYYASCLKLYKSILKDPWQLDVPPAEVIEDIK